jgi:molybdopterin/thiamine biosynthesis adenylyltransferase
MSIEWSVEFDFEIPSAPMIEVVRAPGFPPSDHPAEAGLFARHEGVPAHDQRALDGARVLLVGAGGLGSWVAMALARGGVRTITIIDHDVFDRTNASRQLAFGADLRQPKAIALARNVAPHMVAGGTVTGMAMPFDDAVRRHAVPADAIAVLVDNNATRLSASRHARELGVPAVFSMISADSMRAHAFLQGAGPSDACLRCAVPNMDPESSVPCTSAVIAGCLASAAHATFFVHRALMGWAGCAAFNWRASDLMGVAPEQVGLVPRRAGCLSCA